MKFYPKILIIFSIIAICFAIGFFVFANLQYNNGTIRQAQSRLFQGNLGQAIEQWNSDEPRIISISANPGKVKVGDILTIIAEIRDKNGIEKVSAIMPHDNGADEIQLSLISGDNKSGKWQGEWKCYDTINKEYITTVTAVNVLGKSATGEVAWWDDTETVWRHTTAGDLWNSAWSKRKKVAVTGSTAGAQTSYQVKVTVAYDSDMQADFDDIRFAKSNGSTALDFWLESKTDSSTADFLVEIDSIPASPSTVDIYFYYGNPSASSASSLANTFTSGSFTDTFADETKIDTGASSNIAVSGGEVKLGASFSAYTTPVADSATASREYSATYPSSYAIDESTATRWLAVASAATTDWIKFAIADDTYTTPVSADASRTFNNNIASFGAQLAIDESLTTGWLGVTGSVTDWTRFVIANDTYTTPSAVSASTFYNATYAPEKAIDENTVSTQWMASVNGSVTDWIKFDLGSIMAVDGCRIMQGDFNFNTETVKIESSDDDANWTTLYSGAGLIGEQWKYFNWTSANMRYIKVSVTDPGSSYPRIQEFDYRKTSDNAGNVSVKGIRIRAGKSHTVNIAYSTTDDEDASYTNLKTGVVLAGTYGWNYYAWTAQDLKYIRVSVTDLGLESYPRIFEFDYRTGDEIAGTNGCRIYGDWGNDTVTISISTTDSEDSAFSSVLTGQTVIDGQWNEFSWSDQDTKYIKVAITATAQYPAMTEFDAKKPTYYSSGSLISVTIPEDTSTRFAVGTQFSWNDTEPTNTDAKYQLQYYNGTWQLIPDADLSGNSIGFDTSPKDISSVKTDYGQIRLKGNLSTTDTSVSPSIQDYTITHYYRKYVATEPSVGTAESEESSPWDLGTWPLRRKITLSSATTLADYQVKVDLTIAIMGNPYTNVQTNGGDIRFVQADGTLLDYWIETWSAAGNSTLWVEVATSGTSVIYMYYNNPSASSASNFDNTFTKDFGESGLAGLWHFDEGSNNTCPGGEDVCDSSGQANHGTESGGVTWVGSDGGQWDNRSDVVFSTGDSLDFDSADDYIDCGTGASLNITGDITIEAWINGGQTAIFGDGSDGDVTISAAKDINKDVIASGRTYADGIAYRVIAPSDSATSVTRYAAAVTLSNGISSGDELLLINLQGTSSDNADVGNYEFVTVDSVSATTITFTKAITKSFDGSAAANQKVVAQRVPHYHDITVSSSGSLTASAWDGLLTLPGGSAGYYTGLVVFRADGTLAVASGGEISVSARGYAGGDGSAVQTTSYQGESFAGVGAKTTVANEGAGGGGGPPSGAYGSIGGGGGGYGVAGTEAEHNTYNGGDRPGGLGGNTYGLADLSKIYLGSGGGEGGQYHILSIVPGGKGGGIIIINANELNNAGSITSAGEDGADVPSGSGSGAGGGSGGSIFIREATLTSSGSIDASGGAGGTDLGLTSTSNGGPGGEGRIRHDNAPEPNVVLSKEDSYGLGVNEINVYGRINDQTIFASATTSVWHHVVMTYDGSTQKLYLDGSSISPTSLSGAINSNSNNLIIGKDNSDYFDGTIDEVRIYNRALSAEEVTCHYERRKYAAPDPTTTTSPDEEKRPYSPGVSPHGGGTMMF